MPNSIFCVLLFFLYHSLTKWKIQRSRCLLYALLLLSTNDIICGIIQMALSARPGILEAGSGGAARAGGLWAQETQPGPRLPRRRFLRSPRPRGTSRKGRCEASRKNPADAHGRSVPGSPVNMGMLRAGLCPGLTQDVIQLLRSRGIKTGNRMCAPHS